ncbi:MAG: metallophosphoesterase [Kiritimatiellae bacterium]|jgi:Icc protein|nr:metallophosphoesterase [Kiritimatiellia bacterium]
MLNRRSFIKSSIFAAGAASLGITEITYAATGASTRWALLSDTHIPADKKEVWRGFSMIDNLEALLPGVAESKPDGIGITGDVARLKGLTEDYAVVKEYVEKLAQTAPVHMALGNHDNFKNFNAAFPVTEGEKAPVKGKHVTVINSGPVRMIFLDSLQMTNNTAGLLGKAQRNWLDQYLKDSDKTPTLLFLHHSFGDSDGSLLDDIRFFRVITQHRHVKAVFYGHSHNYSFTKAEDLDLINLPSTAYAFGKKSSVGWVDATFTATGATLKLNATAGNKEQDGEVTEIKWRV